MCRAFTTCLGRNEKPLMKDLQRLTTSVMLATFLAAWDSTVVGTIGPSIAKSLGGLAWYPWMLTGFMVMTTVFTPITGYLSDYQPPEILYQWSIGIFLVGSLTSGTALSMGWFIVGRLIQGAGAGGILTLGLILMGRHFQGSERIQMQGRLSTMWGLAGLLGPTLGGITAQWLSWRGLFAVNIILGVLALIVLGSLRSSPPRTTSVPFDAPGALWLAGWLSAAASAVTAWQHASFHLLGSGLLVAALGMFVLWIHAERRAAHPLIPMTWLFEKPVSWPSLLALVASGSLYAAVLIVPLWLSMTWRFSPEAVGLAILPLPVAWAVGSLMTSPLIHRLHIAATLRLGFLGMMIGLVLPDLATSAGQWPWIVLGNIFLGLGVGVVIMTTLTMVQLAIAPDSLGRATGFYNLARNIGNTLGPGLLGGLVFLMWQPLKRSSLAIKALRLTTAVHDVNAALILLIAALTLLSLKTTTNPHLAK
ncbi:MFS transporter [Sulfobacillus sp. hq2]|nr:MFS transporter [Sulfobacillus sp. hq2]